MKERRMLKMAKYVEDGKDNGKSTAKMRYLGVQEQGEKQVYSIG